MSQKGSLSGILNESGRLLNLLSQAPKNLDDLTAEEYVESRVRAAGLGVELKECQTPGVSAEDISIKVHLNIGRFFNATPGREALTASWSVTYTDKAISGPLRYEGYGVALKDPNDPDTAVGQVRAEKLALHRSLVAAPIAVALAVAAGYDAERNHALDWQTINGATYYHADCAPFLLDREVAAGIFNWTLRQIEQERTPTDPASSDSTSADATGDAGQPSEPTPDALNAFNVPDTF